MISSSCIYPQVLVVQTTNMLQQLRKQAYLSSYSEFNLHIWVVLISILTAYNGSTCLSACSHFTLAIHLPLVLEPFFLFLFAEDQ